MQGVWAMALGLVVGFIAAAGLTPLADALADGGRWLPARCSGCGRPLGPASHTPLLRHGRAGSCQGCGRAPRRADLWIELTAILATAALFALRARAALPLDLLVLWLGITAAAVDLRRRVIPNRLLLAAVVLGLLTLLPLGAGAYVTGLLGATILLGIGLLIAWIGRGGFGLGDVKYLGVVGLLLGWQRGLGTLFLAVLCGGLYAAGLLLTRRATGKDAFAFGPFIALGSVVVMLLGAGLAR